MNCTRIQRLIRQQDSLAETQQTLVEQHAAVCADCAAELASERRLSALLRGVPSREPRPSFDAAVFRAVQQQEPVAAPLAWLERLRLKLEWRLPAPAFAMAAALGVAVITASVSPPLLRNAAERREVMATTVAQHRELEAARSDMSAEAVEASIALVASDLITP